MPSIASKVKALAKSFAKNVAFTTGQLLGCGTRSAVDTALCRLAKNGVIERLAAGVYRCASSDLKYPNAFEIAKIKAERFGKRIAECHHSDLGTESISFNTDGSRSSFNSIYGRLKLKHLSPGKFKKQAGARTSLEVCYAIPAREDENTGRLNNTEVCLPDEKLEQRTFHLASQLLSLLLKLLERKQHSSRQICHSRVYLSKANRHL